MRPLFRLPGEAGFAVALGFTSGFPMGAILTASLKEQSLCTPQEAARLAAFTNNSSPLFLLISVPLSEKRQQRGQKVGNPGFQTTARAIISRLGIA